MHINEAGLALLKSFEKCVLQAYQDIGGVWTCGWGATGDDINSLTTWTQEEADARLAADLERFEEGIDILLVVEPNSNQFSALVCFVYNVGLENFKQSLLLRCVNTNHWSDAAAQFGKWNHVKGEVVPGLTRRRAAEAALFITE